MKRLKLFLPFVVFAAIVILFGAGLKLDPNRLPSVLIEKPMPEFKLPLLEDESLFITQADMLGKAYLLNIWATWCQTCKYEHPYLIKLAQSGIPIYGVNYKDDGDSARRLLEKMGNPYIKNVFDKDGALIMSLGVYGAPETFVVDAKGIIRHKVVGAIDEKIWTTELAPYFFGE